ncbi:40S ribosomal protein S9 [Acanthamoeba castellanii str. Neff]|uniref:U3 small nucleolar ribonucleoprotein protein IMP3 n=1 Tax=Acanthamoeba castellanii (strain ATCC 30010 / Neff) TaxID=1257118 RepID=L8GU91_ACACF|nr:40S ribosomal protein S9 [Acanthamoeba castellanii str. Neff]ELR16183.1 40S ribosomal protein S9 [Acanthamoeba castellanii str. Neff]
MLRQLKPHEQKLLKKVNLYDWKRENNVREIQILRRYRIQKREDYTKYNKLAGEIKSLVVKLGAMDAADEVRREVSDQLTRKCFHLGLITSDSSLAACAKVSASSFCRRRLPVVMVRLKMSENLKEAVTFIEQGHVRVGPDVVTDPAFLVNRAFEDYVTWVDSSKIKEKVMKYNDALDDFDLLGN